MAPNSALRVATLSASLSAAFALGSASPPVFAANRVVQNCGDGGPGSGSLRDTIAGAMSGDTIDLSQLPTKCGMTDSTITLSNGEIGVPQSDLTLQGPSAGSVSIVAAAGSQGRLINHNGPGVLTINAITLANGDLQETLARGGCIYSGGNVFLSHSVVRDCTAIGLSALGGGIQAHGSVVLISSTLSGNKAIAQAQGLGSGGGVWAYGGLTSKYSTLSANEATTFGGGAYIDSTAGISIVESTIEGNHANQCAAGSLYSSAAPVVVSNSTISGNDTLDTSGGTGTVCVGGDVKILNSTIAFNAATPGVYAGGVRVWFGSVELQSSIIARNSGAFDFYVNQSVSVTGGDNIITAANGNVPSNVITTSADPELSPLQFNGGRTRTHALQPGSPAIGAGNNIAGATTDQRGRGYPRVTGAGAVTDIGAFQFDSIFASDFEW